MSERGDKAFKFSKFSIFPYIYIYICVCVCVILYIFSPFCLPLFWDALFKRKRFIFQYSKSLNHIKVFNKGFYLYPDLLHVFLIHKTFRSKGLLSWHINEVHLSKLLRLCSYLVQVMFPLGSRTIRALKMQSIQVALSNCR